MDHKKFILRNTEDLWQEGVTQQDNHNSIFDSTVPVRRLCFQHCSIITVSLSVHSSMDLSHNLWIPEGFVQVRSLTVLGVANFVGNTDVE